MSEVDCLIDAIQREQRRLSDNLDKFNKRHALLISKGLDANHLVDLIVSTSNEIGRLNDEVERLLHIDGKKDALLDLVVKEMSLVKCINILKGIWTRLMKLELTRLRRVSKESGKVLLMAATSF